MVKWGDHNQRASVKRFLERLYHAQRRLCASCGEAMYLPKKHRFVVNVMLYASVDHVVARKAGGTDCPRNKVAMHIGCNSRKGHRPPTGCELIFHALVLAVLDLPATSDVAPHIEQDDQPRARLGDLWPEGAASA